MHAAKRIIAQSLAIAALSAVLAFGVNAMRPDGLPLAQAAPQSSVQLGQTQEIGIKDAALLFVSGRAVFLDARSQYEFELGHIQGAIWLPPREFASQFQDIKPRLAGKEAIIAYCDGEHCALSHALADHLRGAGLTNVYVLKNGWTLWQAEKLPVSKGRGDLQPGKPAQAAAKPAKASAAPVAKSAAGICRDCGEK